MVEGFPFPGKFLQRVGLFLPALYGFNDLICVGYSTHHPSPPNKGGLSVFVRVSGFASAFVWNA